MCWRLEERGVIWLRGIEEGLTEEEAWIGERETDCQLLGRRHRVKIDGESASDFPLGIGL